MTTLSPLAEKLRAGDPDRFAATLFAPPEAREALWTLYAFNLEIARTPWRVSEPQIGAIRLRWWLDALEEIFDDKPPRAHELVEPLAALIRTTRPDARPPHAVFKALVEARVRDLDPAPMASREELDDYLAATSGGLVRLAAWVLLAGRETPAIEAAAMDAGYAFGAANLLRATPALAAQNRLMIPLARDPRDTEGAVADRQAFFNGETPTGLRRAIQKLAKDAADRLDLARARRRKIPARAAAAFLTGWRADAALAAASRSDVDVFRDLGDESEFRRRFSLIWRGWTGRW